MGRPQKRLFLFCLRGSQSLGFLALAAILSTCSSGCLSHRYTISQQELARLAQLPPQSRGNKVHVVQNIGERRGDPVETAPPYVVPYDRNGVIDGEIDLGILITPGSDHHGGGFHGSTPPSRVRDAVSPPPPSRQGGGSWGSHGGNSSGFRPSRGGSNNNALENAVAAAVVILVAVIVLSAVGFAVTEGVRYDGAVQVHAEQPLHLKDAYGNEQVIPLSDLVPSHANQAVSAEIMDDEGWGMRMVERRALDRKGFAFKLDMGSVQAFCARCYSAAGFAANLQFGYFPHHRAGVLATASLGGGTYGLSKSFERHSLGLEAQWFPLGLWRIHLGGFGHAGWQIGREEDSLSRTGIALGGGAILEIALTTRLALMARADWTTAHNAPDGGWGNTQLFTGGLAIY